jgi:2,4-dienoyl-CoA reductase (NADPH2)
MAQCGADIRRTGKYAIGLLGKSGVPTMTALIQHTVDTPYVVGPVHFYSGVVAGDLVLFDTGPFTSEGQKYLEKNIDLDRLKYVFITHGHIDHWGQAGWLSKNTPAKIYLPYRDCLKVAHHDSRISGMFDILTALGFDESMIGVLRKVFVKGVLFPSFPEEFEIAEEGIPPHLGITAIDSSGHSQSDLVYAGDDWVVTGDTLLKGIFQSPLLEVDMKTGDRFRNYEAYCKTIVNLC